MKAYHSIIIFIILIGCTALSSIHSYHKAEERIIMDMNQALLKTFKTKRTENSVHIKYYGDLEGDTIFGLRTTDRILTHVDRKSGLLSAV